MRLQCLLLTVSLWMGVSTLAVGQSESLYQQLERAERYITASRTDEALKLLADAKRRVDITEAGILQSFRLRISLQEARAYRKKRDYAEAVKQLLPLIDASRIAGEYAIEVKAAIEMAYILQRQNSPEQCLAYLNSAHQLIQTHPDIAGLAANLDNRRAGYEYQHGTKEEMTRYANRALITAREHNDDHQTALAHLFLSLGLRKSNPAKSERNLTLAAKYYHNTGSMVDYLVMTLMLNGLQLERGHISQALVSNDSAMVYASQVEDKDSTYVSRVYEYRADIMRQMNRHDSAFHYLKMANDSRLKHLEKMNEERAVEVEANYTNEKNAQRIAAQNRQLEEARQRRKALIWLSIGGTCCFLVLAYCYTRLRVAKRKLEKQYALRKENENLTNSLHHQKILQGEVHHRVKNNLQIINSLLELQLEDVTDEVARSSMEAMSDRIFSMAAVHETLYQDGRDGQIDFYKYTTKICKHFECLYFLPGGVRYDIEINDCWFNLDTAIPLGTMLNELLTNSFKYATTADHSMTIAIAVYESGEEVCLEYHDTGPGFPDGSLQDREGGLGAYLLTGMSRQLQGRVETWNADGAHTCIYFRRKDVSTTTETTERTYVESSRTVGV